MTTYELSKEQKEFVAEAEAKGYKVDFNFSNKYEKGRKCPAVQVSSLKTISFGSRNIQWDQLNGEFVVYAPY